MRADAGLPADRIVAEGLVVSATSRDWGTYVRHAPLTLEATKEAVRRIRRTLSREEGEDLILKAYMSEDFREGMDAHLRS